MKTFWNRSWFAVFVVGLMPLAGCYESTQTPSEVTSPEASQPSTPAKAPTGSSETQAAESAAAKSREPSAAEPTAERITLATTTSFDDTGLAEVLAEKFKEQTGITVRVVPKGTGAALREGREGRADVMVVHAPEAELKLVDEGYAIERSTFMHNSFIIVGPANDPVKVAEAADETDAFRRIAEAKAAFISRGDDSGTHKKELEIWKALKIEPTGDWYRQAGQGMGPTLQIADQRKGYCLSDNGTFLDYKAQKRIALNLLCEKGKLLYNPYSVMLVNPEKFGAGRIKVNEARKFAEFLKTPETQKFIGDFKRKQYGQPLFIPDLLPKEKK